MYNALVAAALTGLATGLGAFPFFFVRELPRRIYDGILGLGAGLMLAAATLGLLSEALDKVKTVQGVDTGVLGLVVAGFVAGVTIAAVMDRFIPHRHARGHRQHIGHQHEHHDHHGGHHHHHHQDAVGDDRPETGEELRRTYLIIGALTIHRIPEGVAIGAGFVASEDHRLGLLLAAAVALQNL